MHNGTGEMYGRESGEGELHMWGGIVSARLASYAGALDADPETVLDVVEAEGIAPVLDTAEAKASGKDRDRPTESELRCLAFTREDFTRLVAAVGSEEPAAVAR